MSQLNASEPAIEVRGVSKSYRRGWLRRKRIDALSAVELRVDSGEIFGLLGPNGAGKTTLLKILLGVIRPDRGSASLLGGLGSSERARQEIGYLPENFSVARHHTGLSALRLLGRLSRMSNQELDRRLPAVLELVGLRGRENEPVKTYSKGMRQRLGLAQSLLHSPRLVFLDEPTDGLDPVGRHDIRRCIERLRDEGKTVFINSHILQEVELLCDRFAIMNRGRVVASGSVAELIGHAGLAESIDVLVDGDVEIIAAAVAEFNEVGRSVSSEETASAVLHSAAVNSPERRSTATIELHRGSQTDVDRLVDLLRGAAVSIVSIERVRADLEQAFIRLVGRPPDAAAEPSLPPAGLHASAVTRQTASPTR